MIASDKTIRVQENNIMSPEEMKAFRKTATSFPWLYKPMLDGIAQHAYGHSSLLDVACGDGHLLNEIYKLYPHLRLTGVDVSPFFIQKAKTKHPFDFHLADAYQLSIGADIVTCNLALHHFEEPNKLINKLIENAKGVVVISDQIRPETERDLASRILYRSQLVDDVDTEYYREKERESILEAYDKREIMDFISDIDCPFSFTISDRDYYERYVLAFDVATQFDNAKIKDLKHEKALA